MNLKEVLTTRDQLSEIEADNEINEMRERVYKGEDPEEILEEYGLEPDYVFDIIY